MELVTTRVPTTRLPWRQLGVLALIAILLAAALAVYIGSRTPHLPTPFGPAGNGLIPYVAHGDIYVGDPQTGATRLVAAGPEDDWGPSFSYDGTRIGFLRDVRTSTGADAVDVYVVWPDGSELRKITPQPITDLQWAQWTPAGRIGVIHRVQTPKAPDCPTSTCLANQLDMYSVDGTGSIERIAGAVGADEVQFRPPDGGELLFRALVDHREALFAMAPDGTHVRRLVTSLMDDSGDLDLGNFVYSIDGTRIFYQRADPALAPDMCCRLWMMNADGSDAHEFLSPSGRAWDGQAAVSPDGTRVAYWHGLNDGPPSHGITIARVDGSGPVIEVGPKLTGTAHWTWSPDSTRILLYPDDGSSNKAYLVDPNGGPSTTVPWESDSDLDWQRLALPG